MSKRKARQDAAAALLKDSRAGKGGWGRYPVHYTTLALSEMKGSGAKAELQYVAPKLERLLERKPRGDKFDARRRAVAERVLARF